MCYTRKSLRYDGIRMGQVIIINTCVMEYDSHCGNPRSALSWHGAPTLVQTASGLHF